MARVITQCLEQGAPVPHATADHHAGKVVHLSTVHHSYDNRVYHKEAKGLVQAGFDLTLVITAAADQGTPVPVLALPKPPNRALRLLTSQRNAWRALRRLRPDVLQVHDPELIPLALAWGRRTGARVVYDAHEDLVKQISTKPYLRAWMRPGVRGLASALVRLADRHCDGIVAATESVAAGYRNRSTVVVRNYPWLSDFGGTASSSTPGTRPGPVPGRVIYAGDLTEERKLSFMIEVVRIARDRLPHAHLVLAGRPLHGAADLVAAQPPGLVSHVGLLPPARLPEFMASGQVGLVFLEPLPNYLESLPTKLFEYMAAGVPFLASDFPFWVGEFSPLDAGRFADSSDPASCAAVMVEMLSDPDLCRRLGDNGRRAIRTTFNFESQLPALMDLTGDLLSRSPRSSRRPGRWRRPPR